MERANCFHRLLLQASIYLKVLCHETKGENETQASVKGIDKPVTANLGESWFHS